MDYKAKQETQESKPPEKIGVGHARMNQKRMEKAKKFWRGGGGC